MRRQISTTTTAPGRPGPPPGRSLGHRAPLLWLVAPFAGGLALAHAALALPVAVALGVAVVGIAAAAGVAGRRPVLWAATLALGLLGAGSAYYQLRRPGLPDWQDLPPREARLTVRIDRTFVPSDPLRASGLATVTGADRHLGELVGQRLFFAVRLQPGEARPLRTAELRILGVLAALPAAPEPGSFEAYLDDAGINFRLTRGQVEATAQTASAYQRFCARVHARCKRVLGLGIAAEHPTLAGLLRAMMLGETGELSEDQKALFMQSGTMHLFAISGLNIGVIALALQAALLLLRLPVAVRLPLSLTLLWLFVDITGASASAVRAFLMAAFLQGAQALRQPANPLAALAGSAWAVLLLEPNQLFGAGFQMSYGIVAALLLLGLPLSEAWQARWRPFALLPPVAWTGRHRAIAAAWHGGSTALAVGLATTLVSMVSGVTFFQLLTPGSLVANLILVPAAMIVTLAGFASLAVGLAGIEALAVLCNHAAALLLLIIEHGVRWGVQVPGAHLPAAFRLPWLGPVTLLVLLGAIGYGYARRWSAAPGGWWPPFVITALALIFGVKFGA
ncbi:MAG: ComEC/Rec2 family competence protein [Opitutaceae bacterium]|nr:ComEC/Rec2 family competence protein [Opitutaceae bacterium]